jgi:mono/diheme cytochrome c family protein
VNLHNRHSGTDPEPGEGEQSPHLQSSCANSPSRRALGLLFAVCTAICCLLVSINVAPTPPVQAFSKQSRHAGAQTFHDKGCEHCHGVDGVGTDRGPELLDIGKRWKKDHIELQIRDGGGGMPPFGQALQADEVKDLVDFLSAKRKAAKKKRPEPPPIAPKPPSDDAGI